MGVRIEMADEIDLPETDIVLKIEFKEGEGSAARPFLIAAELIHALESIDKTLVKSVDSRIETTLIVEDLQKSSIKIFLRNLLEHTDDDALKTLDWKPLVGQFLVKGKYAAIKWLDSDSRKISDLTDEVAMLAQDTADINHIPLPAPPNPARLAQGMDKWQDAKRLMKPGEGLTITLDKTEYRVDIEKNWRPSEIVDDIEGERELVSDHETILMVRKPDMLGNTAWQFKQGKKNLTLQIVDEVWLDDYLNRRVAILPGDAMQVILRTESLFSEKGELLDTKQRITRVVQIIPNNGEGEQSDMDI